MTSAIPATRFLAHVDVADGPACHPWLGRLNQHGYGRVYKDGKVRFAHRVAYELFVGAIPEGLTVDHQCHNRDLACTGGPECPHRRCVNPAHLDVTTSLENVRRAMGRKRAPRRPRRAIPAAADWVREGDEYSATEGDLANYLRVTTSVLKSWRRASYGPAYLRVGKHVRYRWRDVEAWEAAQLAKTA